MEPVTKAAVTVTFLRMDRRPPEAAAQLPEGTGLVQLDACTVPFYRYLYDTVGEAYLWWLRRTLPDRELAALLADPAVSVHVLYKGGEPAGFFELDARPWTTVNLSYFGLMPLTVGTGLGYRFLRQAVDLAWAHDPKAITVNTCSADHPRALPTYIRAGFRPVREVRETWSIPDRLGMHIPPHLRA